jgi:hypothetical protein
VSFASPKPPAVPRHPSKPLPSQSPAVAGHRRVRLNHNSKRRVHKTLGQFQPSPSRRNDPYCRPRSATLLINPGQLPPGSGFPLSFGVSTVDATAASIYAARCGLERERTRVGHRRSATAPDPARRSAGEEPPATRRLRSCTPGVPLRERPTLTPRQRWQPTTCRRTKQPGW